MKNPPVSELIGSAREQALMVQREQQARNPGPLSDNQAVALDGQEILDVEAANPIRLYVHGNKIVGYELLEATNPPDPDPDAEE